MSGIASELADNITCCIVLKIIKNKLVSKNENNCTVGKQSMRTNKKVNVV